jgi:ADP-dependent phosphofructokinase/glucokinase
MGHDVVLGLGGCLDYEIDWDTAVVNELVDRYAIELSEASTAVPIGSERDLVRSVLGFLREGVGGERFVASSDVVEAFAARFPRRITLGGTGVRAALAMSRLGVPSTVHLVSIDDHVRRLLPDCVTVVCSATRDSTDPHLIVQYPAGARIRLRDGEVVASRANRLIYVNDVPNQQLLLSPDLTTVLSTAAVFLVSGFNSMQDVATLERRLQDLRTHMRALPPDAVVVYEDAGFHVPEFSRRVRDGILDLVDVHGMNEDELQAYVGRPLPLLDPTAVATALQDLHAVVPARTLVVHTARWALAYGPQAERYRRALQVATSTAGTRYLHGDEFTRDDVGATGRCRRHEGGAAFARGIEQALPGRVCCVPAFDLAPPTPTLIGLGDAFVGGFIGALVRQLP